MLKSAENGEQLSHRIELKGAQHETIARDVLSEDLEDGELDEGDEGGKTPSVLNCNILPGTEDQVIQKGFLKANGLMSASDIFSCPTTPSTAVRRG